MFPHRSGRLYADSRARTETPRGDACVGLVRFGWNIPAKPCMRAIQLPPEPIRSVELQWTYDCGFGLLVLVDSTPRCLGAYIPSLSISSSTSDRMVRLFHVGFELRCVQLLPRVA